MIQNELCNNGKHVLTDFFNGRLSEALMREDETLRTYEITKFSKCDNCQAICFVHPVTGKTHVVASALKPAPAIPAAKKQILIEKQTQAVSHKFSDYLELMIDKEPVRAAGLAVALIGFGAFILKMSQIIHLAD